MNQVEEADFCVCTEKPLSSKTLSKITKQQVKNISRFAIINKYVLRLNLGFLA